MAVTSKRHLREEEITEVVNGLKLRLEQLLVECKDEEAAETALRTLIRLTSDKPGRPKYPEFDWDFVDYFLHARVKSTI